MKSQKNLSTVLCTVFVIVFFCASAFGQSAEDKNLANLTASGMNIRFDVAAPNSGLTLTIAAPDGQVFRRVFRAAASVDFRLADNNGDKLADGQYVYELRLTPILAVEVKETLAKARSTGTDDEVERDLRKRGILPSHSLVQSGGFSILNGSVVIAGALNEGTSRSVGKVTERQRVLSSTSGVALGRLLQNHARLNAMPDQVIPDDLIVQGSACVGLDCVNNENFGFDTVRLKENNTRLQFDDTSTSAGFPTNNWQIRANGSASGGTSFLAFVDQGATGNSETGTIVLEVDAGAPANSVRVSSLGRVGLRTATPVLDLHANTNNTPAFRLEQNNSGGFTAQTWDIAGNEANFFVRDVTNGSLLPFRIRPGAPTSSIDISADGDVGVAISAPAQRLHVHGAVAGLPATSGTTQNGIARLSQGIGNGVVDFGFGGAAGAGWLQATDSTNLATNFQLLLNPNGGNVGIATTAPTHALSVNGEASKPGGGSWAVFSDERLKTIKGRFNSGLKAVMQLQPLRFEYKPNNALGLNSKGEHVGFRAQAIQQIIPEAVSRTENGYLMVNNDPILWTMLNAIKEQQKEIEQLRAEVKQLRRASRRRR